MKAFLSVRWLSYIFCSFFRITSILESKLQAWHCKYNNQISPLKHCYRSPTKQPLCDVRHALLPCIFRNIEYLVAEANLQLSGWIFKERESERRFKDCSSLTMVTKWWILQRKATYSMVSESEHVDSNLAVQHADLNLHHYSAGTAESIALCRVHEMAN